MEAPGSWDALDPSATMGTLSIRYGAEGAKRIVADAQAGTRKLGAKVGAWLNETGLGYSPAVLDALAAFARASSAALLPRRLPS
jgi:hypothetical protein